MHPVFQFLCAVMLGTVLVYEPWPSLLRTKEENSAVTEGMLSQVLVGMRKLPCERTGSFPVVFQVGRNEGNTGNSTTKPNQALSSLTLI